MSTNSGGPHGHRRGGPAPADASEPHVPVTIVKSRASNASRDTTRGNGPPSESDQALIFDADGGKQRDQVVGILDDAHRYRPKAPAHRPGFVNNGVPGPESYRRFLGMDCLEVRHSPSSQLVGIVGIGHAGSGRQVSYQASNGHERASIRAITRSPSARIASASY